MVGPSPGRCVPRKPTPSRSTRVDPDTPLPGDDGLAGTSSNELVCQPICGSSRKWLPRFSGTNRLREPASAPAGLAIGNAIPTPVLGEHAWLSAVALQTLRIPNAIPMPCIVAPPPEGGTFP